MPIDDETQAAITILVAAGYKVTVSETSDGRWKMQAVGRSTDEQIEVDADDCYAGVVELARQLGVSLDVA